MNGKCLKKKYIFASLNKQFTKCSLVHYLLPERMVLLNLLSAPAAPWQGDMPVCFDSESNYQYYLNKNQGYISAFSYLMAQIAQFIIIV